MALTDNIPALLEEVKKLDADSLEQLEELRIKYISKKGIIPQLITEFRSVEPERKRELGIAINELKTLAQNRINALREKLEEKLVETDKPDLTRTSYPTPLGTRHPLSIVKGEIIDIFTRLGFCLADGPEIEDDWHVFSSMNFPEDHPARDVQDTFYVKDLAGVVLRSQTSGAQIHVMENQKPPIKVIAPGRVYRNENINARKNNFFHQIEGLYVDKNITFGDLKGVLNEFIRLYFGSARPTRFRSSFFPFTEPSAEVDVQCIMCQGKGCRTCSGTGWLEVLGCGMVDTNVLRGVGIDPDVYTGFAFGMGVERLAMLKYAIDDIRLFFNNDKRFLEQF